MFQKITREQVIFTFHIKRQYSYFKDIVLNLLLEISCITFRVFTVSCFIIFTFLFQINTYTFLNYEKIHYSFSFPIYIFQS